MLKEALQYIVGMDKATIFSGDKFPDGLIRTDSALHIVEEPTAPDVKVNTLQGFIELFTEKIDGLKPSKVIAHVANHLTVMLIARDSSKFGKRHCYAVASCKEDAGQFTFGKWMAPEEFIIGMQGCFVPGSGDVDYVLKTASGLTAELVTTSQDDGISQKAGIRSGVVLQTQEIIKPRVKLAPFRTFREVDQPISEFIFRLRTVATGQPPQCALFEADGGRWKLDAIQNVQQWIQKNNTDDLTVIA